ncbi:glycosyltransferase family 4 protein [Methanocella conradii]|uniref:glycosyltransferase family 4 protein n=1 Tax=Methanocella conradii TaxID=1175444 RepID=UPI00157CE132|nr:glycosyltransferase family 4 protein [Methanocella conradii]
MNILYVSPFSHGVNVSPALYLAHLVANRGNNVYFYTIKKSYVQFKDKSGKIKIASPPENVEMRYINNKFIFPDIAYPFINPIKEYFDLLKIIKEKQIDIIHFYFPEHLICLPLLRKNAFVNIPVVLSINSVPGYDWFYGKKYVDFIGKIYSKLISSRIIQNVDMIIPYSTISIDTLISFGCDRRKIVNMISHGVDILFFKPSENKENLREKHKLPKDAFIIIYTGRFVKVKRLDLLIQAFEKVLYKINNAFLLLVGDGPQKKELISMVDPCCRDRVKFIDFVDPIVLSELYAASDMFSLISSGEGISSSLLEACASGLPALVSNVGANRIIVQDGLNGYVINNVDKDSIAQKIIDIKTNYSFLSKNSRNISIKKLNWDGITDQYIKIYYELINKRMGI